MNRKRELLFAQMTSLVWGLQFAFLSPSLALFLSSSLGASEGQVGLVLALYQASGFVASLVIPMIADRKREYLGVMTVCGVFAIALAVSLSWVSSLALAALVLIILGGPAGAGGSLFFAHLNAAGFDHAAVMGARAMTSMAWVAGPPLAMLLARVAGIRSVLVAMATVSVIGIGLVTAMRRNSAPIVGRERRPEDPSTAVSLARLVMIVVAFVLLNAANATMTATMTLYTTNKLGIDVVWGGVALAVAALLEVPSLFLLGRLSSRYRSNQLLIAGSISGILFFVSMTMVDGVVGLLVVQVLNAWFVATNSGVGLTWFMDIIPRPGLASGLFSNAFRVGSIFSGGLIAIAGTSAGYRGMFFACAAVVVLALAVIVVAGRKPRRG